MPSAIQADQTTGMAALIAPHSVMATATPQRRCSTSSNAIWSFDARANGASTATSVDKVGKGNLTADVEGLTVYADGSRKWLIASSQGDNSYAVYDMNNNHKALGRFALLANGSVGVDGTMDTDGIAAASGNLGSLYPQGIFVAQDFNNVDSGYGSENQNFKFASMAEIISAIEAK